MKKSKKIGNKGTKNGRYIWFKTIRSRLKDPDKDITLIIMIPIDTSYEINWAIDLNDPKKAYLELLDQPEYKSI